jgi:hypothetical protein
MTENNRLQNLNFDYIYCKPKTDIFIRRKKKTRYPDIVIYKGEFKNKGNDPMLWVCEIKYRSDWSSGISEGSVRKDIENLEGLLKQRRSGTGIDHAYYLILQRMEKMNTNAFIKGLLRLSQSFLRISKKS